MPSRKRNKGKERKAKKEAAMKERALKSWELWATGALQGIGGRGNENVRVHVPSKCNHGCVALPSRDHAVYRFMNAFEREWMAGGGNGDVVSVMGNYTRSTVKCGMTSNAVKWQLVFC